MIDYKEKLMRLDQEAEKLVDNLARIKDNLVSVEEAKGELETTNGNLVSLIREMEVFHKDMQEAISSLKEINTETLLEKVEYHLSEIKPLVETHQEKMGEMATSMQSAIDQRMEEISSLIGESVGTLERNHQEAFQSISSLISANQASIQELSAAGVAGRNEQMEFQSRINNITGQMEKKNNIITILTAIIAVAVLVGFFV